MHTLLKKQLFFSIGHLQQFIYRYFENLPRLGRIAPLWGMMRYKSCMQSKWQIKFMQATIIRSIEWQSNHKTTNVMTIKTETNFNMKSRMTAFSPNMIRSNTYTYIPIAGTINTECIPAARLCKVNPISYTCEVKVAFILKLQVRVETPISKTCHSKFGVKLLKSTCKVFLFKRSKNFRLNWQNHWSWSSIKLLIQPNFRFVNILLIYLYI